eukprot:NODE_199_length_13192_cov_0.539219.p13 type:complete len:101 gc:universal NODE_199_length_13192_cov_0.539219:6192-6494(+)
MSILPSSIPNNIKLADLFQSITFMSHSANCLETPDCFKRVSQTLNSPFPCAVAKTVGSLGEALISSIDEFVFAISCCKYPDFVNCTCFRTPFDAPISQSF